MEIPENGIIERILKDAREEAKTIVENAQMYSQTTIEEQRKSARQNAEKVANMLLKKAENEANIIGEKVYTDVKRQAGWTVLFEKNRLITEVLEEVKTRLLDMQKKPQKHRKILERLIVNAGTALGGGELQILMNEKDAQLPFVLDELEKEISDRTRVNTQLRVSFQHITAVGVVVKRGDDRIFVDNTFEARTTRFMDAIRTRVAKELFVGE